MHIHEWFARVAEIVKRGKRHYLADPVVQEAGDSLMMKLGEAANRLSRLGVRAPGDVDWALVVANRNFIIHQYDEINRELTPTVHAFAWLLRGVQFGTAQPRGSRGEVVNFTGPSAVT